MEYDELYVENEIAESVRISDVIIMQCILVIILIIAFVSVSILQPELFTELKSVLGELLAEYKNAAV